MDPSGSKPSSMIREGVRRHSPRVQYSVPTSGRTFRDAFDRLLAWADQHAIDVRAARRRSDEER